VDYHQHSVPSKPKLGQNFLRDPRAVEGIAAALGDLSSSTVIEIGPGEGAITAALAARAARVLAIELDSELAANLRAQFPPDQVTIVEQSILHFDFAAAAAAGGGTRLPVAGNLPYYITSPILFHLAAAHASIDRAVLMVQREVADRITAPPGSSDYGVLSATIQMYGPVESLFTLPPSAFVPPPQVHSTVFRWRLAPRFAELAVEESSFLPFLRRAFAQKRKTLSNNLRAAGISAPAASAALAQAAIDPKARAESLSLESFAALWQALHAEDLA
jgi:16S rRNA (adenine1518-N6/adenine1519-N6)-dimethyltransferase